MQETPFQDRGNHAEIAEIEWKLCRKYHFRLRKYSTKFHIKVWKSHFKLRKALFTRVLERKFKTKNVLEFDVVKKDGRIIFSR